MFLTGVQGICVQDYGWLRQARFSHEARSADSRPCSSSAPPWFVNCIPVSHLLLICISVVVSVFLFNVMFGR